MRIKAFALEELSNATTEGPPVKAFQNIIVEDTEMGDHHVPPS